MTITELSATLNQGETHAKNIVYINGIAFTTTSSPIIHVNDTIQIEKYKQFNATVKFQAKWEFSVLGAQMYTGTITGSGAWTSDFILTELMQATVVAVQAQQPPPTPMP